MNSTDYPFKGESRFCLADEVLLQQFGEKALLVNLHSEKVYQLNESGGRTVSLLCEGNNLQQTLAALKEAYHSQPGEVESSVKALLGELVSRGLIRIASIEADE